MLVGYFKLESNWNYTIGILAAFYWVMMSNFYEVSLISGEYCYEPLEKRPRFWATHQVPKCRSNHLTSWLLGLSFCSGFSQSTMRTLCPIAGLPSRPFIVNPHPREAGNERGDPQTLESCKWWCHQHVSPSLELSAATSPQTRVSLLCSGLRGGPNTRALGRACGQRWLRLLGVLRVEMRAGGHSGMFLSAYYVLATESCLVCEFLIQSSQQQFEEGIISGHILMKRAAKMRTSS